MSIFSATASDLLKFAKLCNFFHHKIFLFTPKYLQLVNLKQYSYSMITAVVIFVNQQKKIL